MGKGGGNVLSCFTNSEAAPAPKELATPVQGAMSLKAIL